MSTTQIVHLYDELRTAIATSGAMNVLYASGGDVVKARTIRPVEIEIGYHGADVVKAHDSIRRQVISLRIDRFVAYGRMAQ
jgi:hypothetical protein